MVSECEIYIFFWVENNFDNVFAICISLLKVPPKCISSREPTRLPGQYIEWGSSQRTSDPIDELEEEELSKRSNEKEETGLKISGKYSALCRSRISSICSYNMLYCGPFSSWHMVEFKTGLRIIIKKRAFNSNRPLEVRVRNFDKIIHSRIAELITVHTYRLLFCRFAYVMLLFFCLFLL